MDTIVLEQVSVAEQEIRCRERNPAGTEHDFPVVWLKEGDENYHWTRDQEHMPGPITPMYNSFAALTAGEGRGRTVERYAESILGRDDRVINGYDYTRLIAFSGTDEEVAERARRNREIVGAVSARLQEVWEGEWKPALEAIWVFWSQFPLQEASMAELVEHLEGTVENATDLYEIHYLMGPPMWHAIDAFEKYYCDLFPGKTALDAHRLLQGFESKTAQINQRLWELGRKARGDEWVTGILNGQPPKEALRALEAFPEGQEFLAALQDFLSTDGQRSDLWDWGYPSWADDPTPVLSTIRQYLVQPDRDYGETLARAAADREAAVSEAREALRYYPRPLLEGFERLLRSAQTALVLTEDHTYYMDFNGFGWVRRVVAEFGRRFAAEELLWDAEDVFYLTIGELRTLAKAPNTAYRSLAAERRREWAYWAGVRAPLELGKRPEKPMYVYSAEGVRMARYCGVYLAEEKPVEQQGILRGQAGSAGKVCGRARVILSLAEANRLEVGDILVTRTTAPPWTPLFLTAGGLVTDAGGLLSHGAVVAREFRIPAVVGTLDATRRIRDGQWIEVDGSNGVVRFEEGG